MIWSLYFTPRKRKISVKKKGCEMKETSIFINKEFKSKFITTKTISIEFLKTLNGVCFFGFQRLFL